MASGINRTKKSGSDQKGKAFQPAIGQDFGKVEEVEARTRDFLAKFMVSVCGSFVAVTGVYGLATANYTPVIAVWAVAGPIIGAVVAYYFGPKRNETG